MKQYISVIASYTVIEAIRNRFLWLLGALILFSILISLFIADLALIEADKFQLSFLPAILRIGSVFICSLIVITGTTRDFQDKNHELALSTSITRTQFLLGKLFGYFVISIIFSLTVFISLLIFSDFIPALIWSISLLCELFIITSISLLFAAIMNQVVFSITATVCFYLLSRLITSLVMISNSSLNDQDALSNIVISWIIKAVSYVLPDLSLFTKTEWITDSLYEWNNLSTPLIQALIYIVLISAISLFDFNRKNI